MIPQKLYIPTSTLNFNNIMSSESISPASFYESRGYGYKRLEKVSANDLDNLILLYSYCPVFQIEDEDRDNYPLVIEVDTTQLKNGVIIEKSGAYFSEQTIYLNALSSRLIFSTYQERALTISKSNQSIETKLVEFYKLNMVVRDSHISAFAWKYIEVDDINNNKKLYIEQDIAINRLKGFLYLYALAVRKTTSFEIINLKSLSRKLYNIWSAVILNPNGYSSEQQNIELKRIYSNIDYLISIIEGIDKRIIDLISDKLSNDNPINILKFLKDNMRYDVGTAFGFKSYNFNRLKLYETDNDNKIELLDKHIIELDHFISTHDNNDRPQFKAENMPEISSLLLCSYPAKDKIKSEFMINLFNTYFTQTTKESFVQNRMTFATIGGKLFKNSIIERWEVSDEKKYINKLRSNLKNHTPFDVNSINNLTLRSFAAYCISGNTDIDRLDDYLIQNQINDYKVAWGLWGIMFGFADISKITYNEILEKSGDQYFLDLYKYIFAELHEVKLEGKFDVRQCNKIGSGYHKEQESQVKTTIPQFQRYKNNITSEYLYKDNEIRKKLELGKVVRKGYLGKTVEQIYDTIMNIYIRHERDWNVAINNMRKDKNDGIGESTIIRICDNMEIMYIKPIKKKHNIRSSENNEEQGLFSLFFGEKDVFQVTSASTKKHSLWNDTMLWTYLKPFVPKKSKRTIEADIEWFQNNYKETFKNKKGESEEGRYCRNDKDNIAVIDNLRRFFECRKDTDNPKMQWVKDHYTILEIDKIIDKIKSKYQ